jgi:proteic killer suppression protein
MIRSFKDKETERIFHQQWSTKFPRDIQARALKKLLLLNAAESEMDLRNPPGNPLERLKGDRAGEMSIRINRQWRICFRFQAGHASDVGIEDYH